MADIKTEHDIDDVISNYKTALMINEEQSAILQKKIRQITSHKLLKDYYCSDLLIYNERDIINKNGMILRPDRVVINSKNEAVIIDYKTGKENIEHRQQLQLYQDELESMHIKVIKKFLVYINNGVTVSCV